VVGPFARADIIAKLIKSCCAFRTKDVSSFYSLRTSQGIKYTVVQLSKANRASQFRNFTPVRQGAYVASLLRKIAHVASICTTLAIAFADQSLEHYIGLSLNGYTSQIQNIYERHAKSFN